MHLLTTPRLRLHSYSHLITPAAHLQAGQLHPIGKTHTPLNLSYYTV